MKSRNGAGVRSKRKELGDSYWPNGHPKGSSGGTSLKGKTYEEIFGEEEALRRKQYLSDINPGSATWDKVSKEKKESHAENARQNALLRHSQGWDNKAGRCKKYKYHSDIAGDITVDGTWELSVAKWLDEQRFNWRRNKNRFEYTHLNGHRSFYTPDFWVEELGGYLEVKGYETKLDRCKWSQFAENLTVWKKQELQALKIL